MIQNIDDKNINKLILVGLKFLSGTHLRLVQINLYIKNKQRNHLLLDDTVFHRYPSDRAGRRTYPQSEVFAPTSLGSCRTCSLQRWGLTSPGPQYLSHCYGGTCLHLSSWISSLFPPAIRKNKLICIVLNCLCSISPVSVRPTIKANRIDWLFKGTLPVYRNYA